ncbi:MAG: acetylornithine transaminase [Gemmatimonadetes bacterium]|nr:acetylornithine transaminase [Gemmatimonadota bacterium]
MSGGSVATAEPGALLGLYRRPEVVFVRGEGPWLEDADGRRYLDFTAGIGVTALGHGSPVVADAVRAALDDGIIHTSNLFRTVPGEALAEALVAAAFPSRVFFCNSGAEAVEAAFKFARRWARAAGGAAKHEIVALTGSFHGRLFGSLAATDRPAYREPFEPLMPGVRFVDAADPDAMDAAVSAERTAAVIAEPVQGEGGVRPLPPGALERMRALCDARGVALVFDEIQCGLGRTGRLFAHEHVGVRPDLLVLAKPLAGGLPMGAVLAAPHVADALEPGDHGTTFGGGPLVARVAGAVLATLADPAFLEGVRRRGARLEDALRRVAERRPDVVTEVRGMGLMWGVELTAPAGDVVARARESGLLLASAGPQVVRLLPPLNVPGALIERAVSLLEEALP